MSSTGQANCRLINVKHIDEIPKADIQTAVAYCHKIILEGELVEPELLEAPKNAIVLSYPKAQSCLKFLLFEEMHNCGWLIKLPELLVKLKRGERNTSFTVDDISGIEHEMNSLMHLVEVQRHKLSQIHRISEC